jgi:UDPglucose 6-dehydrogenase
MKIAIVGSGYVGLVAGACFADTGTQVVCVDVNEEKLARLRRGEVPFFEPNLSDMVKRNWPRRLEFSSDLASSIKGCDAVFIAVGTPPNEDGAADLSHVVKVAEDIARLTTHDLVLVLKSTVPVGTNERVRQIVKQHSHCKISVVSNPEFLKEGDAVNDFLKPDRVVIGTDDDAAFSVLSRLYAPFLRRQNRIQRMNPKSAEIVKYASNALLATKVSFVNEIAALCEAAGADVEHVRLGMGADARIGYSFLFPGLGFGGSCFPKDLKALVRTGQELGVSCGVAEAAITANARPVALMLRKLEQGLGTLAGKVVTVWGLSFKPNTDDVRESAALKLIQLLVNAGVRVKATDPEALGPAKAQLQLAGILDSVALLEDEYEACVGADALVVATEWPEYRNPDLIRVRGAMKGRQIYDGRNILLHDAVVEAGFAYHAIGRPSAVPAS